MESGVRETKESESTEQQGSKRLREVKFASASDHSQLLVEIVLIHTDMGRYAVVYICWVYPSKISLHPTHFLPSIRQTLMTPLRSPETIQLENGVSTAPRAQIAS